MMEEEFIRYLGQNNISIFQFDGQEEFLEELANAENAAETYQGRKG